MTPDQFTIFLKENERATGEAIEKFVNGKIKAIDTKLTEHIERVEPVIKAYEESELLNNTVGKYGERTIFLGKIATSFGVIGASIIWIINYVIHKP